MKEALKIKPYERANRSLLPDSFKRDERGGIPGLYFWGPASDSDDEWVMYDDRSGEYKISLFYCTYPFLAAKLVVEGYAQIVSYNDKEESVMLHMKREY